MTFSPLPTVRFEEKESVQANFGGPEDYVKVVEFSRGGDHLVSGGTDGIARVFKYPSLKLVAQLPGSKAEIGSVSFNTKGDLVRSELLFLLLSSLSSFSFSSLLLLLLAGWGAEIFSL